jgi:Fe-S cluster biosynthesis and repair protein YggX
MNATELEQFSTWDKFFAIANIATLTPAVASIANKFAHASLAVYDAKKLLQKLDNVNASSIQALQSLKNSIKSLLGVNVAGNTQFSKNAIASINGFSDNISNLAVQNGIDLNTFKNIQKEAFVNLTTQEKIIINNLRNNIPSPDANTILQKAIPKSEFNDYLSGYRNQVGGYITTAKDAKHLNTFDEIYYGMRLDYSGTKFSINDGSCGVIRYKTSNVSSIEVPRSPANGGSISDLMPFTGHGFTSAENGLLGVPEWKSGYLTPNEGAELWEVFSDGTEILIATFSTSLNKFILVP